MYHSEEYLGKLRQKDPETIRELVVKYDQGLHRCAARMGLDPETQKDLVQNTWGTFMEVLPRYQGRSHIRTFLIGILYKKGMEIRRIRKKHEKETSIEETIELQSGGIDPERQAIATETLGLLNRCFSQLPQRQRSALWMKEIDGKQSQEICEQLKISTTHLGVLIFRARNQLKAKIPSNT